MAIVGVGFDSPAANLAWAESQGFQYQLWSDMDRVLALHYGAATSAEQSMPARVSRLLDEEGRLIVLYDSVSPSSHAAEVLEDCQLLFEP